MRQPARSRTEAVPVPVRALGTWMASRLTGVAAVRRATGLLIGVVAMLAPPSAAYALAAPKPPPPKPPSVYTGTPSASLTSVTFKGSVDPRGLQTVYAFQFGTTTSYGAQTAPTSAGNGTTTLHVSQTMTGLTPGVTYHCRLIATNGAGTTNGNDVMFTIKVPLKLTITATPNPVVFGSPLTITGVLSGTGAAGDQVVLQAKPFLSPSAFTTIAGPVLTSATGGFSFSAPNPAENTRYRVATATTPLSYSRVVGVLVAPRVILHVRPAGRPGFVRMYGTIVPAQPGARVAFQLIRRGPRPLTVGSTILTNKPTGTSRFSRIVRIRRRGLYRAVVLVLNHKLADGHSRAVQIR